MVSLKGVVCTYPGEPEPCLQGLDLEAAEGECVLLTGPSGSGKSTAIHLLNGLFAQVLGGRVEGQAEIEGLCPVTTPMRELSRRVGTVFQNPGVQIFMPTVEDDVAFGCENLGLAPSDTRERRQAAMEAMGLAALARREVTTLSGGERQRLAIAGALAAGCRTLLLDEPLSDLDEAGRSEVVAALGGLRARGHTILLTEHRRDVLRGLADREVRIEGGRLAQPSADDDPLARRWPRRRRDGAGVAVEARDCAFSRPGMGRVLSGVDLCLRRGEVVALVGPNGSGKSTLLWALCGLLQPGLGTLEVLGVPRPRLRDLVGRVGLLLQNPDEQVLADSLGDEIAFGPRHLGLRVDVPAELAAVGLGYPPNRHPLSLSRGERQRLAAAAVLASSPELVLLDEPTSGLDRAAWMALMDRVVAATERQGATVVYATHEHEVVAAYADRVVELAGGRVTGDRAV